MERGVFSCGIGYRHEKGSGAGAVGEWQMGGDSEKRQMAFDADKADGGGGDVAFEDEVLDDFVVGEGMDVVVEGGGDFDFYGVVAGVEQRTDVVVYPLSIPFYATAGAVDFQFADVVDLAEVDDGVGAEAVVGDMGGVDECAGEVFKLGLAEVAELLDGGVAGPSLDGMVESEVPFGLEGVVVHAFVVGWVPSGGMVRGVGVGVFEKDEKAFGGWEVEPEGAV